MTESVKEKRPSLAREDKAEVLLLSGGSRMYTFWHCKNNIYNLILWRFEY